jgi:Putative phage tail protein/SPRY domain
VAKIFLRGAINYGAPVVSGLQVTSSALGKVIPVLFGRSRVAANVVDLVDFTPYQGSSGAGKAGGGGVTLYDCNVILGLCEGPINALISVFDGRKQYPAGTTSVVQTTAHEVYPVNSITSAFTTVQVPIAATYTLQAWVTGTGVTGSGFGTVYTLVESTDFTRGGANFTILPAFWSRISNLGLITDNTAIHIVYNYNAAMGVSPAASIPTVGGTLFTGALNQAPWSFMTSAHPTRAIGYNGLAYIAAQRFGLDSGGGVPNMTFELDSHYVYDRTKTSSTHPNGIIDANPKDIVVDILTHPIHGAFFPWYKLSDLTQFSLYCTASGLFFSPVYDRQTTAADVLKSMAQLLNVDYAFTDNQLKIVPYGDATITGDGISSFGTWTPNLTAQYALTFDNLIDQGKDKGPVQIKRKSPTLRYNQVIVKYRNRTAYYNDDQAEAKDEADIALRGLFPMPFVDGMEICDPQVARNVAQLILQRQMAVNQEFNFWLPFSFCQLEPMDLVTLTDSRTNLSSKLLRITEISESKDGHLEIVAEEVPFGAATSIANPVQVPIGYTVNFAADPGQPSAPVIFDAPGDLTNSGYEVWCAVDGTNANWGGCHVWVSTDGTNYKQVGAVYVSKPARYGSLTASVPATADPDTTDTISVDLTPSAGVLTGGTNADADNYNTLCWLDKELISFSTATLTAANKYNLTSYIRRGLYGTGSLAHSIGAGFVRLDGNTFAYAYDPSFVGKTIYFKFTSFNAYGGSEYSLATAIQYSFTISGPIGAPKDIAGGTGLATPNSSGILLSWSPSVTRNIQQYEIRLNNANWGVQDANYVGSSLTTTIQIQPATSVGVKTWYVKAIDTSGRYSINALVITLSVSALSAPSLTQQVVDNNVLLFWTQPSGTQAVKTYEIRKGSAWATATLVGQKSGLFTTLFETVSGTYTYWIAGIDIGGIYGAPSSVTATVNAPPDYVLKALIVSGFEGSPPNSLNPNDCDTGITLVGNYTSPTSSNVCVRGFPITNKVVTYFEFDISFLGSGLQVGILLQANTKGKQLSAQTASQSYYWRSGGAIGTSGTEQTVTGLTAGQACNIGVKVDLVANTITFYMNGTQLGTPITIANGTTWCPALSYGSSAGSWIRANFGAAPFECAELVFSPSAGTNGLVNAELDWSDTNSGGNPNGAPNVVMPVDLSALYEQHFTHALWENRLPDIAAVWATSLCTIAGPGVCDGNVPLGGGDGYTITVSSNGNDFIAFNTDNTTNFASTQVTYSVYLNQGTKTGGFELWLRDGADVNVGYAIFTLTGAGSVSGQMAGTTATISQVGSTAWYLCSITATFPGSPAVGLRLYIDPVTSGTTSQYYYVFGAQLFPGAARGAYWETPQAQVTAGFPVLIEPAAGYGYFGAAAGSYREYIDYGAVLGGCKITATYSGTVAAGSPVVSCEIDYSNDGTTWTNNPGVTQVFGTNFRYVKVTISVAASTAGLDLYVLNSLSIRLDVKLKNDAGNATTTSSSADTTVTFAVPFIAITSLTVTPMGTTGAFAIADFNFSTANPTTFGVRVYNSAGTQLNGAPFSWAAKGY